MSTAAQSRIIREVLAEVFGDPTEDLLPIAASEPPTGSTLNAAYEAVDTAGRRWRFVAGEALWYMVDPNVVSR